MYVQRVLVVWPCVLFHCLPPPPLPSSLLNCVWCFRHIFCFALFLLFSHSLLFSHFLIVCRCRCCCCCTIVIAYSWLIYYCLSYQLYLHLFFAHNQTQARTHANTQTHTHTPIIFVGNFDFLQFTSSFTFQSHSCVHINDCRNDRHSRTLKSTDILTQNIGSLINKPFIALKAIRFTVNVVGSERDCNRIIAVSVTSVYVLPKLWIAFQYSPSPSSWCSFIVHLFVPLKC